MLSEGLPERGEITPEDLAQCITDINEKIAKLPEGPQLNPAASDEAVAAVAGKLPPLMDVLLLNHNGYWIGDFMLYTAEQLMGDVGTAIGNNPLEASVALAWVPETGELVSIDTDSNEQTAVAPSFGAFFESFRDSLVANKWEFADGWVSTE